MSASQKEKILNMACRNPDETALINDMKCHNRDEKTKQAHTLNFNPHLIPARSKNSHPASTVLNLDQECRNPKIQTVMQVLNQFLTSMNRAKE
ncbi:hypothetical protein BaRGS_00011328 [Batillaria attramentaria]|uniref:Uncharacterized protein n=1 Tax=Batillaria attramentaria TaxID=370345 RepID=A0ABD0LDD2_9CAEN